MEAMDVTSQHLHALLEAARDGIYCLTPDGRCTFVNTVAVDLFGYTREELLTGDMHALVHQHPTAEQSAAGLVEGISAIFRGDASFRQQLNTLFRKGGGSFLAEVSAEPVRVEDQVLGVVITVRDTTKSAAEQMHLQLAEREIGELGAKLDMVLDTVPQGVYVADASGGPLRLNRAAVALSGEHFPAELETLDLALTGESAVAVVENNGRWLRSTAAPVHLDGELIAAIAVNSDVTHARLQEEALRKSEKLAALGQLSSAIAHEINDPLESITNCLYLIRHAESVEQIREFAQLAESELIRVSDITTQILRFHRPQRRPAPVSVEELARTVMALYTGRLLVRGVHLEWRMRPTPKVVAMGGELQQVLNNLVRNAFDAMPDGGTLFIRVNQQREARPASGSTPREGVRITVADTGEGIDPKIAGRLFQPFQTTKEHNGTGLGLWVSLGIIEKQGGQIRMRTSRRDARHGTVFSIWLPVGDASSQSPEPY